MLETTLSSRFVAGANLKGEAAGANWLFLLPHLPLERTICLGAPTRTTLVALADFNREVNVLLPAPQSARAASKNADLLNVDWCALNEQTLMQWREQSVDLVMAVGRLGAWQLGHQQWLQEGIRRLLKPDGLIYHEYYTPFDPLRGLGQAGDAFAHAQRQAKFWLTPLFGEVSTVTLLNDHSTIQYFAERELFSSSLKLSPLLKRAAQPLRGSKRRTPHGQRSPKVIGVATGGAAIRHRAPFAYMKSTFRRTGVWLMNVLDQAGATVERQGLRSRTLQRAGVLSGGAAATLNEHPPQYLEKLAREAGITLDGYAWGLVAPADYSSRKLLFFLLDHTRPDEGPPLRYIVKMVRNSMFNGRLENECRALRYLHASTIRDRAAVPRVVFAGHHADLAVVGESAIEGAPFRSRTSSDADCPYLHQAIGWLTDLGAATASWGTSNAGAAQALTTLLEQFLQFYRMAPAHQAFLTEQIEIIAGSSQLLPAVFQHGDPGLWNLLVTSAGKVAFLDWEAAETAGMPLWDLFYFLRSYSVNATRSAGKHDSLHALEAQLLADTPLRRVTSEFIRHYCVDVQVPDEFIEPLFYTCWMHRANKRSIAPCRDPNGTGPLCEPSAPLY